MKFSRLWSLSIETSPDAIEALAEALGDAPAALTILAPPRSKKARLEALYNLRPDEGDVTARLAVAAAVLKIRAPKFRLQQTPSLDWLQKVAGDFPPLPIARWTVHGTQHRAAIPDRRHGLQIDATNAFGTGEHATTRGCLFMLDWVLKKKSLWHRANLDGPLSSSHGKGPARHPGQRRKERHMLDMGCGSGILAMAWAKAGHGQALGIDCDPDSIRIAKDNVQANGLAHRIRLLQGYGYNGLVRRQGPYDLIMANIFARPLARMAKDLRRSLRPGGVAILSGLLAAQTNLVLAAHRMQKIYPLRIFRINEWVILVLRRRSLKPVLPGNKNSTVRFARYV